jgi:hypothetical protein
VSCRGNRVSHRDVSFRASCKLAATASSSLPMPLPARQLRHAAKGSRGLEAFGAFQCGTQHLGRMNALKEKS